MRQISVQVDGTSAAILLPEELALVLAQTVSTTVLRLRHLRALHKLGQLSADALYEGDTDEGSFDEDGR